MEDRGDEGDEGDEVWRDGRLCQPGALAEGFNSSEFRFGAFGVFRGLLWCGGSPVALTPIDAVHGQIVHGS